MTKSYSELYAEFKNMLLPDRISNYHSLLQSLKQIDTQDARRLIRELEHYVLFADHPHPIAFIQILAEAKQYVLQNVHRLNTQPKEAMGELNNMNFRFKLSNVKINVPEVKVEVEIGELSVEMDNLNIKEYGEAVVMVAKAVKDMVVEVTGKEQHAVNQETRGRDTDDDETSPRSNRHCDHAHADKAKSHDTSFDPYEAQRIGTFLIHEANRIWAEREEQFE